MLIGGFILVFSLAALIMGASMFSKTLRVRHWPQTAAALKEKEIVRSNTPSATTRTAHFEVRVKYEFSVKGETYTGTHLQPTAEIMDLPAARKRIEDLGDEVSVYYNPQDPAESYVRANSLFMSSMMMIVGIFCGLIGAAMLFGGGKTGG